MTRSVQGRRATPLDEVLDVFRVRQYFNILVRARDVADAVRQDIGFLDAVRRAALPMTARRRRRAIDPFPGARVRGVPPLQGRVGVVSTGGSGALASLVGVGRALEETGTRISVWSVCSGSALFGFPLGAGMPADEVADFVMSLDPRDYVDPSWRDLAKAVTTAGRGWAGVMRGDKLEAVLRRELGDRTLADLSTPVYAPIWSIERNAVDYIGPRTHPDMPVAHAIRMAISLPLFVRPVVMDGQTWCDGGIVDIFPVHPILDIEPPVDTVIAVNGFYPTEFTGEDASGWECRRLSLLHIGSQVRTSQQVQLARENLARLRSMTRVLLVEPVPYYKVQGAGFYRQWLDTSEWASFMSAGREATLDALRLAADMSRVKPDVVRASATRRRTGAVRSVTTR
jgi:NTE family protein